MRVPLALGHALRLALAHGLVACSAEPAPPIAAASAALPAIATTSIRVNAGEFTRGRSDGRPDEAPAHEVRVSAFSIDATLVSRADFARFVAATGYATSAERAGFGVAAEEGMDDWAWARAPRASWRDPFLHQDADSAAFLRDDAPVVMVSWFDAVAYCAHAGGRLPTEAEWEYAMGAGAQGTRYPWGEEPTRDGKLALNFWQGVSHHQNLREDGFVYVSPVRAFSPNAWGLYDPVGNVWQWVADWYAPDAYRRAASEQPVHDPKGPDQGHARVLRGGSWWCGTCTCAGYGLQYRGKAEPKAAFNNNGFRCARDLDPQDPT